jgi:hypothetical protein
MQMMKLLAGLTVVLVFLFFFSGCATDLPGISGGAPDTGIDYNAVYFDGSNYSYWAWDPAGFWTSTHTPFLPTGYAGRSISRGHPPENWGSSGINSGSSSGRSGSSGINSGSSSGRSGRSGINSGGSGVHSSRRGTPRSGGGRSGNVIRSSGSGSSRGGNLTRSGGRRR